jgi:hypothetical protein
MARRTACKSPYLGRVLNATATGHRYLHPRLHGVAKVLDQFKAAGKYKTMAYLPVLDSRTPISTQPPSLHQFKGRNDAIQSTMDSIFRRRRAGPAPMKPMPKPSVLKPRNGVPGPDGETTPATFALLPPEIHEQISKQLIYPDALSLKHTSRYFYRMVDTGVRLKVEWLMERRMLHLECPNNTRCDLGSDLRFCRGSVAWVFLDILASRWIANTFQATHAASKRAHRV